MDKLSTNTPSRKGTDFLRTDNSNKHLKKEGKTMIKVMTNEDFKKHEQTNNQILK